MTVLGVGGDAGGVDATQQNPATNKTTDEPGQAESVVTEHVGDDVTDTPTGAQ